jgi:hypothetical protein
MSNPNAHGTPGNKSRTGMGRPPGSGRPNNLGEMITSFTIRISASDRDIWKRVAGEREQSVGALIREAMAEYLEGVTR